MCRLSDRNAIKELTLGGRLVAFLLVLPMLTAASPPPQQAATPQQAAAPQQPAFGARVARVRVDAIVTDSDGQFVADLGAEDFQLREDGEPQRILGIQLIDLAAGTVATLPSGVDARAATPAGGGSAGGLPPGEPAPATTDLGALIFVIDGPSLDLRAKRRFAAAWSTLLNETASLEIPRAAFLVSAVGTLEQLTPLTLDVEALEEVAADVLEVPTFGPLIRNRLRQLWADMRQGQEGDVEVQGIVRAYEHDELTRSLNTFDLLTRLCDAFAVRPGRTALVWVSTGVKLMEGGPFSVLAGLAGLDRDRFLPLIPDGRIQASQQTLHEAANSANVSIYALDPTLKSELDQFGVDAQTATLAESTELRSFAMQASLDGLRDSLRNAAQETSGRSFIYGSNVGQSLAAIREDISRYYLLTYASPRAEGDGEYHEIDLRVAREGVTVRAREGYVDWSLEERRIRTLAAAMAFPGAVDGLPLQAKALRRFAPDGRPVVQILARVERPAAEANPALPVGDQGTLEFFALVLRGDDVVDEVRKTVRSAGEIAAADGSKAELFLYLHELDLEPGSYDVRLAARGAGEGELGATRLELEVAEPTGGWRASDLVLLGGDGGGPARPLAVGTIAAGEVLTVYSEVIGGQAPVISGSVYAAGGTTLLAEVASAPLLQDGSSVRRGTLRLRGLGPGTYVVQVDIADAPAGESASFRVPLEVADRSAAGIAAEYLFGSAGRRRGRAPSAEEARLGRLAAIYQPAMVSFTARETIVETRYSSAGGAAETLSSIGDRRISEFEYVYGEHGLDGNLSTGFRRRMAAADPDPRASLAAFESTSLLGAAHGWPLLVARRNGRPAYRYVVAGEDSALGRPAVLIAFRPTAEAPGGSPGWFGTAWIDRETSQILRVYALGAADHEEKVRFMDAVRRRDASAEEFTFTEITTDFWEEMNGLRFPGQVAIKRNRYRVTGDIVEPFETFPELEVAQTYTDYRFLAIPSADEIRRLISGPGTVARE